MLHLQPPPKHTHIHITEHITDISSSQCLPECCDHVLGSRLLCHACHGRQQKGLCRMINGRACISPPAARAKRQEEEFERADGSVSEMRRTQEYHRLQYIIWIFFCSSLFMRVLCASIPLSFPPSTSSFSRSPLFFSLGSSIVKSNSNEK